MWTSYSVDARSALFQQVLFDIELFFHRAESLLLFILSRASHLVLFDRRVNIPCPWLFLLCLPVRKTKTIMSWRESSWGKRKAFHMSLSQNARMYFLSHKIYCTIGNFKMMPFQACVVSKNTWSKYCIKIKKQMWSSYFKWFSTVKSKPLIGLNTAINFTCIHNC